MPDWRKRESFFDARPAEYEEHQLNCIEKYKGLSALIAEQLPTAPGCKVLDLGCGTGLELDEYFALNPHAEIAGIDLAPGMLGALRAKHPQKS